MRKVCARCLGAWAEEQGDSCLEGSEHEQACTGLEHCGRKQPAGGRKELHLQGRVKRGMPRPLCVAEASCVGHTVVNWDRSAGT